MNVYSLMIGFGASIGLIKILLMAPTNHRIRWLITGIAVLLFSWLGARLVYMLSALSYFSKYSSQIFNFSSGGYHWFGAIIGFIFSAVLTGRITRTSVFEVLDRMCVLIAPLTVAAWLAAWQSGLAYGSALETGTWWGMMTKNEIGTVALRAPVQPLAAVSALLFLALTEKKMNKSHISGDKAGAVGMVFALHCLVFSFMRADPVQHWLGLRLDTWMSLFTLIGILTAIFVNFRKKKLINATPNSVDGVA